MFNQIDLPSELVEQTVHGNTVLFVGAGLSMSVGFPSWSDLMSQMLDWAVAHGVEVKTHMTELYRLLRQGKYLLVAEELRDRMGESSFKLFLEQVFRDDTRVPGPVHHLLPEIPFAAVLTTNYDVLIESVYAKAFGLAPRVFTQRDTAALASLHRRRSFYVLKVHGDIDRVETVVLGRRDYREAMFTNAAYREFLSSLFLSSPVLFVGFSLTDPDLVLVLDEMQAAFKGYGGGHYALLSSRQVGPIERKRWQQDYGVQIIPYAASRNHPEVLQFLASLATETMRRKLTPIVDEIWRGLPHRRSAIAVVNTGAYQAMFCDELMTRITREKRNYVFCTVELDLEEVDDDIILSGRWWSLLMCKIIETADPTGLELLSERGHDATNWHELYLYTDERVASELSPQIRIVVILRGIHRLTVAPESLQLLRVLATDRVNVTLVLLCSESTLTQLLNATQQLGSPWWNVFAIRRT